MEAIYTCTCRIVDKNGKYSYYIAKCSDKSDIRLVTGDQLKEVLEEYGNIVDNLKLTSDNRIILVRGEDFKEASKYGTDITYGKHYRTITVGDLIEGHIVNQNIPELCGKRQRSGDIKEASGNQICGVGYICNKQTIQAIRKCYGSACTLRIMDANEVRASIIQDTRFRHRLSIFYAEQMRKPEYMHLERVKSAKAHKAFAILKKNFMTAEYLEQDVNLLFTLFTLYGYHMYTFEHSVDVAIYSCMLYYHMHSDKLSKHIFEDLFLCGLLHDVGKLGVRVEVLDEKGTISSQESWQEIQTHPICSSQIVSKLCECDSKIFVKYKNNEARKKRLILGVMLHHRAAKASAEGRNMGYPNNWGNQNSFNCSSFLKIISVADCFDGMISPRPYRARKGQKAVGSQRGYIGCAEASKFLRQDALSGKLGEREVEAMLDMIYNDGSKDFDDEYGDKINDIKFALSILSNFRDLTKADNYVEI